MTNSSQRGEIDHFCQMLKDDSKMFLEPCQKKLEHLSFTLINFRIQLVNF
jgi:hypothetical protein